MNPPSYQQQTRDLIDGLRRCVPATAQPPRNPGRFTCSRRLAPRLLTESSYTVQITESGLALETVFSERFVTAASAASTGSKMPRADWKVMKCYPIAIPADQSRVGERYQDLFQPIADKIAQHTQQNRELTRLRDWLLPLLMNGQVRVA